MRFSLGEKEGCMLSKKIVFVLIFLLGLSFVSGTSFCQLDSAEVTYVNTNCSVLSSPNDFSCKPGENVLITCGVRNNGASNLQVYVICKVFGISGDGNGQVFYDSDISGENEVAMLETGALPLAIEFEWAIPQDPNVLAYSVYIAVVDYSNPNLIYDSIGGFDDWRNGPLLHVPYDNGASGPGSAVISWVADPSSESSLDETGEGFLCDFAVGIAFDILLRKLAPSMVNTVTSVTGGAALSFLTGCVGVVGNPNIGEVKLLDIIDGNIKEEITIYGDCPVYIQMHIVPGDWMVYNPVQIVVEKEMGFLQPRQTISTFSITGIDGMWGGTHLVLLKNPLTFSEAGTYYVRIVDFEETSEGKIVVKPSVDEGVTENDNPFGTAMMTFEDGVDEEVIQSTISGMEYTTTLGYDWVYGDKTTDQYNVYPYGSQAYSCKGNVFAWLGPNMGEGRIDFPLGPATYFSVLTSTASGLKIDAYNSDDNLIATSGWATDNTYTNAFTRLSVQTPGISYVIIHDSGNFWLIDDLVCNAPSLTFSPMSNSLNSEISLGETEGWIAEVPAETSTFKAQLIWGGSNLDFFAFDPIGNYYSGILVGENKRQITVENPTPGYWQLIVYGDDIPSYSEQYTLTIIPTAGISLTKTPSSTMVVVGSTVSYLYNATNTGETALTGAIYDDIFGAVGSFVNLQPGGWVGYNVSHIITETTTNVATAWGIDQYEQNATATATATVNVYTPTAGISLTKTPSSTMVVVGSTVSYLYNATNTGETALTGAIYDDIFGAVGSFVNLQPGGWVGYNVSHIITETTTNVATAWGIDQYEQNATATATATVEVYSGADIKLTKTPSATIVLPGTPVSYLYNVTNIGETPLTGGIYDDQFGAVGSFVNLQPGGWVAYNVTHTITENTTNTATAWGVNDFGTNVTDSATAFVQVTRIPQVIPEVPLGTVIAGAAMVIAFGAYKTRRPKRPNKQINNL